VAGVCWLWLIDRSQFDSDDEVRDRATFYLNVLNEQQKALNLTYIINGTSHLHCGCLSNHLQHAACVCQFALVALSLFLSICLSVSISVCLSLSPCLLTVLF